MDNFKIDAKKYFSKEIEQLDEMVKDGLVVINDNEISLTYTGRDFTQNISNIFDKYDPPGKSYTERLATIQKAKAEQAKVIEQL